MQVSDTVVLQFHAYGLTSEEPYYVVGIEDNVCTLDTSEELHRCFRFNMDTGECLNDVVWDGSRRTLKMNTEKDVPGEAETKQVEEE